MSTDSTRRKTAKKPTKPHPDFPLYIHRRGYWAKKVRGKTRYFGKVASDPKGAAALELWLDQKDALLAGRTPRSTHDGLTIHEMCNHFLTLEAAQRNAGGLANVPFAD